jgi:hypothetical protein
VGGGSEVVPEKKEVEWTEVERPVRVGGSDVIGRILGSDERRPCLWFWFWSPLPDDGPAGRIAAAAAAGSGLFLKALARFPDVFPLNPEVVGRPFACTVPTGGGCAESESGGATQGMGMGPSPSWGKGSSSTILRFCRARRLWKRRKAMRSSAIKTTVPTVAPATTPAGVVVEDGGDTWSPTPRMKVDELGSLEVEVVVCRGVVILNSIPFM